MPFITYSRHCIVYMYFCMYIPQPCAGEENRKVSILQQSILYKYPFDNSPLYFAAHAHGQRTSSRDTWVRWWWQEYFQLSSCSANSFFLVLCFYATTKSYATSYMVHVNKTNVLLWLVVSIYVALNGKWDIHLKVYFTVPL